MSWLHEHLESFVRPVLGDQTPTQLPKHRRPFFTPQEMTMIKGMWRSVKRGALNGGKRVLLAGRDVFIFEVLARREDFPTTFRPDISRHVVSYVKEDYSDHFLFDTGFLGSIPKGLKIGSYTMASSAIRINPKLPLREETNQVFPRMRGARSLALKIERTPKYWRAGFYRDGTTENPDHFAYSQGIHQELSSLTEFLDAAYLTIEIYKDSSPRSIDAKLDIRSHVSNLYLD